jgi:hypothetical protein
VTIRTALVALLLSATPAFTRVALAQEAAEPKPAQAPADPAAAPDADPGAALDAPVISAEAAAAAAPAPATADHAPAPEPPPEPASAEPAPAAAPVFAVKGFFRLQAGVFVPLISDGFSARKNEAYVFSGSGARLTRTSQTCDPVQTPNMPCYALDHGKEAGDLSMGRGTLQLDGTWTPSDSFALRTVVRGVRAMELPADEWAQIPTLSDDPTERRQLAREWVHQNYYNELDLRQLYFDARVSEALSFRVGRQLWRDTGQYRLLDVVNPANETWHFGPLESYEDTRTPLWMLTSQMKLASIDHSLELIWVPLVDRPRDTVTAPLSVVGAWGLPYSNTPSPFVVGNKVFDYPGRSPADMRAGLHWKGDVSEHARYSLLYYYTHQIGLPIPSYFDERLLDATLGLYDSNYLERLILKFPRQHLAGASFEYAFEAPVAVPTKPFGVPGGLVAKLEALIEANKTYPVRTDSDTISGGRRPDPMRPGRWYFEPEEKLVTSYALSLSRPTMIPALNAEMPFLFVGQFIHNIVPGLDEREDAQLTEIPGFNEYEILQHQMKLALAVATIYMRGFLVPKVVGGFVFPDSGFYSLDLGVNLSPRFGMHLTATDFFGADAYQRLGLFRDRDEVNLSMTVQF